MPEPGRNCDCKMPLIHLKSVERHYINRTLYFQLEEVKWRLNLEMGSSSFAKSKEPNAMFELGVRNDTTQVIIYMSCHHSLGATGATLNTRNASS